MSKKYVTPTCNCNLHWPYKHYQEIGYFSYLILNYNMYNII